MSSLPLPRHPSLRRLGIVVLMVAVATMAGYVVFNWLGLADVLMLYMLCITVAATQFDRWMTLAASALSILAMDFFFVEPRYTFVLTDIQHIATFGIMLGVGWVILGLAERIRAQARRAQERERHTRALYRLSAVLAQAGAVAAIQDRVETYLCQELENPLAILLCDPSGQLEEGRAGAGPFGAKALALARAAMAAREPAGHGTRVAPGSPWLAVPMRGTERVVGVLLFLAVQDGATPDPERLGLLEPLAAQISLALERATLEEERTVARIKVEHEQLRNTLLSSVSHDLRTPLGTITGATTALLNPGPEAAPGDQRVLLNTIHLEAARMLRLVTNLLEITKLESGQVKPRREWVAIEDAVGSAIGRLDEAFEHRPLRVDLPEIWVLIDPALFDQALFNLLDNALKFSPPGSGVAVRGWMEAESFHLMVADQGPGIPAGEEERIFEKLYRGTGEARAPGAGLGLAICKGIAQAHGGAVQAGNRAEGGAQVVITLPIEATHPGGTPPGVELERTS